jgi:hypothetical protein
MMTMSSASFFLPACIEVLVEGMQEKQGSHDKGGDADFKLKTKQSRIQQFQFANPCVVINRKHIMPSITNSISKQMVFLLPKSPTDGHKNRVHRMFTARPKCLSIYTNMPQNLTARQSTIQPLQSKLDQQ